MHRSPLPLAVLALLLPVAGCGDESRPVVAGDAPVGEERYTASTTVLERDGGGPQLCLGGVLESYPPQCGGPEVVGWDWDAVDDAESVGGTTWGAYTVVGTWDGERLTLTEPPGPPTPPEHEPFDLSTPCPPPPGGWAVEDPATTTDQSLDAVMGWARARPDFAGAWVDQSANPASEGDERDESAMNDPSKLVLNLRVAGDVDRYEAEARSLWGGALCVSEAARPLHELEAIHEEVHAEHEPLISSVDEVHGVVELQVPVLDPGLQESLDERYGEGTVVARGVLRPVG